MKFDTHLLDEALVQRSNCPEGERIEHLLRLDFENQTLGMVRWHSTVLQFIAAVLEKLQSDADNSLWEMS